MPSSGRRNLFAGMFTLVFGALVVWQSSGFSLGTPQRMGPGFFPMALGVVLLVVGAALILQALKSDEAMPQIRLRPLIVIPAALAVFAVLIDRVGFVVSALAVVLIAGFAEKRPRLVPLTILSLVLLAITYAIFIVILGVPFRLFAWRL